jgi:hypothetical protein
MTHQQIKHQLTLYLLQHRQKWRKKKNRKPHHSYCKMKNNKVLFNTNNKLLCKNKEMINRKINAKIHFFYVLNFNAHILHLSKRPYLTIHHQSINWFFLTRGIAALLCFPSNKRGKKKLYYIWTTLFWWRKFLWVFFSFSSSLFQSWCKELTYFLYSIP